MSIEQFVQPGIWGLVGQAGFVVKLVLLILLSASIFSWAVIFLKWRTLRRARIENIQFVDVFWHGKSLDSIFEKTTSYQFSSVVELFKAGFKELKKLALAERSELGTPEIENIQRALMRTSSVQVALFEKNVGWLATIASAAPFVGLFGTVWGIMDSFHEIGVTGSANLAVVAPGISEALIATAVGLAAAIPAVVAYNYFIGQIKALVAEMDCFSHDYINLIQRSFLGAGSETQSEKEPDIKG